MSKMVLHRFIKCHKTRFLHNIVYYGGFSRLGGGRGLGAISQFVKKNAAPLFLQFYNFLLQSALITQE
jgi:hypothetical protein